ncbi:MAG: potassium channel family protein [Microthrixaceae bacterium]
MNDQPPPRSPNPPRPPKPPSYGVRFSYRTLSAMALFLVVTATLVYRILEGWTWIDSIYFSVIAITTVGFGDLTPTTNGTKLFTVAYVIVGVGLVATVFNERLQRHHEAITWIVDRAERHERGTHDDQGGNDGGER